MTEPNDMAALMAQAQEMKAQLDQAQQEIMAASVVGEAGNGLVKATMGGNGQISDLVIDPKVVDPEDVDTLQDLILGALADAHQKSRRLLAEEKSAPSPRASKECSKPSTQRAARADVYAPGRFSMSHTEKARSPQCLKDHSRTSSTNFPGYQA